MPIYDRREVLKIYDEGLVIRINELIEMESKANIPMSDIYLLLPLDVPPLERAKRLALANGFKLEKKSDNPYVVFMPDEEAVDVECGNGMQNSQK